MEFLLFLVINGITVGGVYALVALGFVLIYKATGAVNFAQGEVLLLGAYLVYAFLGQVGWPVWASVLASFTVAMAVGWLVERLFLRPLVGEPVASVIMVTVGLAYVLRGVIRFAWGSGERSFPAIFPTGTLSLGLVTVKTLHLWALGLSAGCLVGFSLFFRRSSVGIRMRAAADNQRAALSLGIDVNRMFALSWMIAALLATVGGMVIGQMNVLNIELSYIGLTVFPVVILGGLDSIPGAVVGGVLIGILENLAGGYLGVWFPGAVKLIVPYVVLLVILLVRPYGLLGTREIERL